MWHLLKQPFNIYDKPKTWKNSCYVSRNRKWETERNIGTFEKMGEIF